MIHYSTSNQLVLINSCVSDRRCLIQKYLIHVTRRLGKKAESSRLLIVS